MATSNRTILYIITKSNFGGAQKYVFDLALAAKKQGYNVAVACGNTGESGAPPGLLVEKLTTENIPTHIIKSFQRDMSLMKDIQASLEILRLLLRIKPDTLHLTSSKAGAIGVWVGRLVRVKNIIFTSHGLTMDETWRPWWQQKLILAATWLTLIGAHHSIMINSETTKRTQKMPGLKNKIHLIYNGISAFSMHTKEASLQQLQLALPAETQIIGGIGELHPNKQWDSLIRLLPALPSHIHLVIIGPDGGARTSLMQLIASLELESRVHLTGHQKNAKEYLALFDVFILPSAKEGLPFVLLEAALAQVPIIASDLPGNRDIIDSGENGILIDPRSTECVMAITMLLRDQSLRTQYATALHEKITTTFAPEKMYQETFALYR